MTNIENSTMNYPRPAAGAISNRASALIIVTVALLCAAGSFATPVKAQASPTDFYSVSIVIDRKDAAGRDWDQGSLPDPILFTQSPAGRRRWGTFRNTLQCTYSNIYIVSGTIIQIMDDADSSYDNWNDIGTGPVAADPSRVTSVRLGGVVLTITPAAIAAQAAAASEAQAALPRALDAEEIRGLLVRRVVASAPGTRWTFEPAEPFAARIVGQMEKADTSLVTVFVETSSTDGRQRARGQILLVLRWRDGRPVFVSAESTTFSSGVQ